ncbi:helix-turn-helix domain-containing protein [Streptomyces sp. MA5143a]|uniref:helix-turn-helix domain-containing protein n=1 Tax=Streptomyces sp. MA5143a TaxID=2083010 RepID=UPI000D2C1624|nr:helix-turn-helix transcriptional regulator [Streptomyces sp. MA5143a]SPF04953.1 putative transcriptional regulator [Streptomyces sp. MA5143a]
MPIAVDIDVMLARRKMSVGELAERVGITPANLAVLKNGRARAVRFTTLEALCEVLECQPGDLLRWEPGPPEDGDTEAEAVQPGEVRPGAVEVDAVEAGTAG